MSAADDLRERLAKDLWDHDNSDMTPEWREMAWDDMDGDGVSVERSDYEFQADALMPTVREALADAWDEGYADGGHDEHEFRPGRRATNPWREADQ